MRQVLKRYQEWLLLLVAFVLVGGMVWSFVWGMSSIGEFLRGVFGSGENVAEETSFQLEEARTLLLRVRGEKRDTRDVLGGRGSTSTAPISTDEVPLPSPPLPGP